MTVITPDEWNKRLGGYFTYVDRYDRFKILCKCEACGTLQPIYRNIINQQSRHACCNLNCTNVAFNNKVDKRRLTKIQKGQVSEPRHNTFLRSSIPLAPMPERLSKRGCLALAYMVIKTARGDWESQDAKEFWLYAGLITEDSPLWKSVLAN